MKKLHITLLAFLSFVSFSMSQIDSDFGVKGGLNLTFFKVTEANFGDSVETQTGFYGGVFMNFHVDEFFSIQPEVLYIAINDFNFINAPIYAKYQIANNLHLLAGPSLNYFFDFFNAKLKIRGDISTAYNITPKLDAHIKFTLGFEEITPNGLFFGLGYKL